MFFFPEDGLSQNGTILQNFFLKPWRLIFLLLSHAIKQRSAKSTGLGLRSPVIGTEPDTNYFLCVCVYVSEFNWDMIAITLVWL